ncbi:MAG: hypothetical protein ABR509_03760 [Candidatus Limnocylindria bacterium]
MDAGLAQRRATAALVVAVALLTYGCGLTQTPFARTAEEVGSEFAAAAQTLDQLHGGRLTAAYARAAFEAYGEQLNGVDQELPRLEGAPDEGTVGGLVATYRSAFAVVDGPCLDSGCDWQAQSETLHGASESFLAASGG